MGNKTDKSIEWDPAKFEHGGILILTDEVTHQAGQQLKGTVNLYLKKQFQASMLQIEMFGREKIRFTQKGQQIGNENELHCNRNNFLYSCDCLHRFDQDVVAPGQYQIPFTITLPEWLPSSFIYFGDDKLKLRIEYKLKASMVGLEKLDAKKEIIVRQMRYEQHKNKEISSEECIKTNDSNNVGQSRVHLTCEKDAFNPNEMLNIKATIDNTKCFKNLDVMTANLIRRIEVRDGAWSFIKDEILKSQTYKTIQAGQQQELMISFALNETYEPLQKQFDFYKKHLNRDFQQEEKAFQELLAPTTNSKWITCQYYVAVDFEHEESSKGVNIPSVMLKFCIYPPTVSQYPQQSQVAIPPEGWNPSRLDVIKLDLPNQSQGNEYQKLLVNTPYYQSSIVKKQESKQNEGYSYNYKYVSSYSHQVL